MQNETQAPGTFIYIEPISLSVHVLSIMKLYVRDKAFAVSTVQTHRPRETRALPKRAKAVKLGAHCSRQRPPRHAMAVDLPSSASGYCC